ncbi:MAG: hypothetical protein LV479_10250 [Methylacidiphilales bacterium]|nr:hypothetical protein [Candidatus Methylacidiphilales bacterium]
MKNAWKILILLLVSGIVLGQTGCATTDSDLSYTRKTLDNSGDTSYHGWNSVPQETSQ